MQIKETSDASFGTNGSTPLDDVVVLGESAGIAVGARRTFSARVQNDQNPGCRCVEIPVIGCDGEISGVVYRTAARPGAYRVLCSRGPDEVRATGYTAPLVVHDINNLFAVISGGLRLLENQKDAQYQKAIIGKLQEAIVRGASLSRQLLDFARPRPKSNGGFVAGSHLAAIAGTLDQALRPDVAVRTEVAPDLWAFDADPEELYFALLNLCRNADDAMPDGGTITVAARNVEPTASAAHGFVEIVVADDGEGMTEEVLSRAFTPYFTTKAAGRGTGVGLAEVRRFAEGRGGAIGIESERGAGTLVRLLLPRIGDATVPSRLGGADITYTPSQSGGVFHVVDATVIEATSWS